MTVNELNSLYYIDKEIRRIKRRIRELKDETGIGGMSYDGMPKGGCVSSPTERIAIKKAQLLEYLIELQERKLEESTRIHQFIYECKDARAQSIMSMRFIDQRSWYIIGLELHMDRSTAQRYLKNYLKNIEVAQNITK